MAGVVVPSTGGTLPLLAMGQIHTVKQGECLASIARAYGFSSYLVLYEHPANANLKLTRPNPNQLAPGDLVAIPEPVPVTAKKATGQIHEFRVEREKPRLRLILRDVKGEPLKNQDYLLELGEEQRYGATDGNGLLDEPFGFEHRTAKLTVVRGIGEHEQTLVFNLKLGHVDPVTTVAGAQGRLANLGLYAGAIDGIFGPITRAAVLSFQALMQLPTTGDLDDTTRSRLESYHDGAA